MAASRRLAAVEYFSLLEIPDSVEELAQQYLTEITIPRKSRIDAFHIAVAVINEIDYIVSWNFHHISNVFINEKIRRINDKMGLATPTICTPEDLINSTGAPYEE